MSGTGTADGGRMMATDWREEWPGVVRWWGYSPRHKVDLMSCAVEGTHGWVVFDPIGWPGVLGEPFGKGIRPVAIVLTNENHGRDSEAWRAWAGCPVWAATDVDPGVKVDRRWPTDGTGPMGWERLDLAGGAPGESAWGLAKRNLVVVGDAVVNLAGRGLELLPDKYCTDPKRLRESLGVVVAGGWERMLMAHGEPLGSGAARRVRGLLGDGD